MNFEKINRPLMKKSGIAVFFILFFINFSFSLVTSIMATSIDPGITESASHDFSLPIAFFAMVFFAPIFETAVFQLLIIEVGKHFKLKNEPLILISALAFGAIHHYNIAYVVVTFVIGLLYAFTYCHFRLRLGVGMAFLAVWLMHALKNLFAFINNRFLDLI